VTVFDPTTGTVSGLKPPAPGSEASYKFWKPVLDEVGRRLKKRGWFQYASFGHNSYCWPQRPQTIDVAKRIWPDAGWSYSAHNGQLGGQFKGTKKETAMPIFYSEAVWTQGRLSPRGYKVLLEPGRDKELFALAAEVAAAGREHTE
jgi:hypothetical protein